MAAFAGAGDDFVYAISSGAGNNTINLESGSNNFYAQAGNNTVSAREGVSFEQLSLFKGSQGAGNASTTFIFANNVSIGEVANSTVAALNNAANFV